MSRRNRLLRHLLETTVACGLLLAIEVAPATAQSLEQALAEAYVSNPQLDAQRAQLRSVDENVPQALGGWRPTVQGTASTGYQNQTSSFPSSDTAAGASGTRVTNPSSIGLSVTQPVYNFYTAPGVRRAEAQVQAQRATLLQTEQQVLLQAITAYMDVVTSQAVLALNINNEQVLQRQLQASQDRFRVGEITRTDVSQAESRLSGATAARITAEGQLNAARATYARVIGKLPGELKAPSPKFKLPANLEEATRLARDNNPAVLAAVFTEKSARETIDQQFGQLLPSVSLNANLNKAYNSTYQDDRTTSASVTAQLTIPLYQQGIADSRVRQAKHDANRARLNIEDSQRQSTEAAIRAWEQLVTARASIKSRQAQIRSAEIALEGVRQEAQVGSRTVLDVLNQEQELVNARVELVRSQRDEVVAAFTLLSAIGQLSAQQLNLPVQYYDYQSYYRTVRDKWWGTGIPK